VLVAGVALFPRPARADHYAQAARAEALFAEGRKLMAAKDYEHACPRFAESQALDPAPGTMLNLASCYERAGKTASAWGAYKAAQELAQNARQKQRAAAAATKAAELEPKVGHITVWIAPESRIPSLEVQCDGETLRPAEWGIPLPYDPGPHEFAVAAPGHRKWTSRVEVPGEGQNVDVTVPSLEADTPARAVATGPAPPPLSSTASTQTSALGDAQETPSSSPGAAQRVAGLVIAGVGIAGIGFGVYAYVHASGKLQDAKTQCPGLATDTQCATTQEYQNAQPLRSSAVTWENVSIASYIAGGALVAGGLIVFLTAPHGSAGTQIGIGPATQGTGLSLSGRF
jgi:serine/threonine-protein kinase